MASNESVGSVSVRVNTLYNGRRFKAAITDFKNLKTAVYDADKSLIVFQNALANTTKSVAALSGAVDAATANILQLSGALQTTGASAKNAKNGLYTTGQILSGTSVAASGAQANVSKMGYTFQRTPTLLNPFNKTLVETNTGLASTADKSKKATNSIGNFRQSMAMAGKSISMTGKSITYGTLPLAAIGIASANMATEFEQNMNRMVSLANVSMSDMQKMKDPILDLASTYGIAGEAAADSAYFIASSGFKASETLGVLETSLMASKVGMGDVKSVADLLTSAINAYGKGNLSAARAGDIMQAAIAEGKFEADEMAEVMGSVIPIASELDISFADTAATLAVMSKTGTDAYKGATQLRGIMSALLKPSVQGSEALAKVGLTVGMVRDKIKKDGLYSGLLMLRQGLGDNKEALAKVFPNVRGLAGFLNVMGKQAKYSEDMFRAVNKEAGQLGKAFDEIKETPAEQYTSAINAFKIEMIRLGIIVIPIFTKIIKKVTELFKKFNELPQSQKDLITKIGILAAVFGPLLVVLGAVIQSFSVLVALLKPLGMLFGKGGVGIARFAGPVGIALVVITALIAGITALTKNSDEAKAKFTEWGQQILTALSGLWDTLKPIFNGIKDAFFDVFGGDNKQQVMQDLDSIIDAVVALINSITWFFETFGDDIIQIWRGAFEIIRGILGIIGSVIRGDWKGVWDNLVGIVKGAVKMFMPLLEWGFKGIDAVVEAIASVIKWPFIQIGKFIGNIVNAGIDKLEELVNKVEAAISKIKELAKERGMDIKKPWTLSPAYQIGKEIFDGKANGGIANPGDYAIVGDSPKPEFVISQTGPRNKNIELLGMAADALGVPMFADGGMTKKGKKSKNKDYTWIKLPKTGWVKIKKGEKPKDPGNGGDTGPTKEEIQLAKQKKQARLNRLREAKAEYQSQLSEKYSYYERKYNMDGIVNRGELKHLLKIKDNQILNLKSQRGLVKQGSSEWNSFNNQIKNLELDKKQLVKDFKDDAQDRKEERAEAKKTRIEERKRKKTERIEAYYSYLSDRYSYLQRKYNMDDKINQGELTHLIKIKNQQIKNLRKQQRMSKKGSLTWKSFETKIQELALDKQQLRKDFVEQQKQGGISAQMAAFNQERFALLSSFGGNIRARSQVPVAAMTGMAGTGASAAGARTTQPISNSKQNITINQEFKERPTDPHTWTRNVQNEIAALI